MVKAVIFDMDGVLIDSEPIHEQLEKDYFNKLGLNISDEEHSSFMGTSYYLMWNTIKNRYNLPNTIDELINNSKENYLNYLNDDLADIVEINGVSDVLKSLYRENIKLAIASSSSIEAIKAVVNKLKLGKYFKVLVSGDFVKESKPQPDIFLFAAEKLGVKPENCLVIEDSRNGVIAAKKANMKCIGFGNPNSKNQDLSSADLIINDFIKFNFKKFLFK